MGQIPRNRAMQAGDAVAARADNLLRVEEESQAECQSRCCLMDSGSFEARNHNSAGLPSTRSRASVVEAWRVAGRRHLESLDQTPYHTTRSAKSGRRSMGRIQKGYHQCISIVVYKRLSRLALPQNISHHLTHSSTVCTRSLT